MRRLLREWFRTHATLVPCFGAVSFVATLILSSGTQTAVANGDTRTIYLFHVHTHETIAATFRINGQYDPAVLKQLNWFLRDWRRDEPTSMDPRLFDVVWEVYRSAGGGTDPVTVMSAYRSPETNAMLRHRSRAVAEHSQHMLGKAMDTSMPGMSMEQIREIGMRLQRGGVGYYPTAGTPFVHLDVGSVRSWPRMNYDQLVRLFPDGKTVHLPTNGQPLARYEEARAEIAAGGASAPPSSRGTGFFAWLFGSGSDGGGDDEDAGPASAPTPRVQVASRRGRRGAIQVASADPRAAGAADTASGSDDAGRDFFATQAAARNPVPAATFAQAESNLPRGETYAAPAASPAVVPQPVKPTPQRTVVASLETVDETGTIAASTNTTAEAFVDHPAPPRRPIDLASYEAPLPPSRPLALAAFASPLPAASAYAGADIGLRRDPISNLLNRDTPPLRGSDRKGADAARPVVAAIGPLTGLRLARAHPSAETTVVPARLDRSNFHIMTAQQPAARMTSQNAHGAVLLNLRSAARTNGAMLTPNASGTAGAFATMADAPSGTGFALDRPSK